MVHEGTRERGPADPHLAGRRGGALAHGASSMTLPGIAEGRHPVADARRRRGVADLQVPARGRDRADREGGRGARRRSRRSRARRCSRSSTTWRWPPPTSRAAASSSRSSCCSSRSDPEHARRIIDRVRPRRSSRPPGFTSLGKADPQQLSKFILAEQPQTIALILAHLDSSHAAQLLSLLPETPARGRADAHGEPRRDLARGRQPHLVGHRAAPQDARHVQPRVVRRRAGGRGTAQPPRPHRQPAGPRVARGADARPRRVDPQPDVRLRRPDEGRGHGAARDRPARRPEGADGGAQGHDRGDAQPLLPEHVEARGRHAAGGDGRARRDPAARGREGAARGRRHRAEARRRRPARPRAPPPERRMSSRAQARSADGRRSSRSTGAAPARPPTDRSSRCSPEPSRPAAGRRRAARDRRRRSTRRGWPRSSARRSPRATSRASGRAPRPAPSAPRRCCGAWRETHRGARRRAPRDDPRDRTPDGAARAGDRPAHRPPRGGARLGADARRWRAWRSSGSATAPP